MRRRLLVLLTSLLLPIWGCGTASPEAREPAERVALLGPAQSALERGDDAAALAAFSSARRRSPGDASAWLGELRLTPPGPDRERLLAELDGVLEGSRPVAAERLGSVRVLAEEDPLRRRAAWEQRVAARPDDAPAQALLAELLAEQGDHERAWPHWEAAVAAPEPPPFALKRHALAALERGAKEEALISLLRYESYVPEDFVVLYNVGTLLLSVREDEAGARRRFERAHALRPDDLDTLLNLASATLLGGDLEGAKARLDEALLRHPEAPDVHFNLAVYWADHADDPRRAVAAFERYLELGGERTLRVARWIEELREEIEE